jgi:hypothetical protein
MYHVYPFSGVRMRVSRLLIAAAFAAVATSSACNESTSTAPVGKLSVQVVDADGVGVRLAAVDLYKGVGGDAILWRAARTDINGIAVFGESDGGLVEGDYLIHVSFSTNFHLASSEANDKPVTVHGGDDLLVTFQAEATVPHL